MPSKMSWAPSEPVGWPGWLVGQGWQEHHRQAPPFSQFVFCLPLEIKTRSPTGQPSTLLAELHAWPFKVLLY